MSSSSSSSFLQLVCQISNIVFFCCLYLCNTNSVFIKNTNVFTCKCPLGFFSLHFFIIIVYINNIKHVRVCVCVCIFLFIRVSRGITNNNFKQNVTFSSLSISFSLCPLFLSSAFFDSLYLIFLVFY